MKLANVTPVHKKGNRSEKDNYRPVSILPNLSKVFERCIYNQIARFFDKILSKHQCCFRNGHSAQHFLIVMIIYLLENKELKYLIHKAHGKKSYQKYSKV